MKTILRIILPVVVLLAASGTTRAQELTARADSAYNETAYTEALNLYTEALDSLGASTHLYYNIGNTYYRLGDLGRAVLWYERALQLDPTNNDARDNLAFVNTRITDKPANDRSLVARIYDSMVNAAHPDKWAWITFALFTLTVLSFVGYLVTRRVTVRKICFFGGGLLIVLTLFTLSLSLTGASRASDHDYAIITSPSAQLSTAPRESVDADTQAFLLHEGTKVEVVDSVIPSTPGATRWYEVKVAGSARAWINGNDMERI